MRKLFYSAVLFAATMIAVTSCDKNNDEKTDIREQAVGDYNVTYTTYISDGNTYELLEKNKEAVTGTISIDGEGLKLIVNGDIVNMDNIAEASNGFTFDIKNMTFFDDGKAITLNGYNGYELKATDGTKTSHHGGYISDKKTLEFYVTRPKEELLATIAQYLIANDEKLTETLKELEEAGNQIDIHAFYLQSESAAAKKYNVVIMEISCVKK